MKTYTALTVSALIVASTMNSASAMESYCKKLPNPDKCVQKWGHGEGTANNDFGKAYKTAGGVWSKMCIIELADIKMTAGAALGDPCCKWTGSPTEATQFPVSFTVASVCPAGGDTGDDTAPSTNEKGMPSGATTDQDSYGDSTAEIKSDIAKIPTSTGGADSPATPPATPPATSPTTSPAAGGCAAKGARKLRS